MTDFFSQHFTELVIDPYNWSREGQRAPVVEDFAPSTKDVLGMLCRADASGRKGCGEKGPLLFTAVILALNARTPERYEEFAALGRRWEEKCNEPEADYKDMKQVMEIFALIDVGVPISEDKRQVQKCFYPHKSARICFECCRRYYGSAAASQHVALAALVLMSQESMKFAEESLNAEVARRRNRNATFLLSLKELDPLKRHEQDVPRISKSANVMSMFCRYVNTYIKKKKNFDTDVRRQETYHQKSREDCGRSPKRQRTKMQLRAREDCIKSEKRRSRSRSVIKRHHYVRPKSSPERRVPVPREKQNDHLAKVDRVDELQCCAAATVSRKEQNDYFAKVDQIESLIKALICKLARENNPEIKEAIDILAKLQEIYRTRLDTLTEHQNDESLRTNVLALRQELKVLTTRVSSLFDPQDRLKDIRAQWTNVVNIFPDLVTALPAEDDTQCDVIDVMRHVLSGTSRILSTTTTVKKTEEHPIATAAETQAYEFFIGEQGMLRDMKHIGAIQFPAGAGEAPTIRNPAEIARRMSQGEDVRNDVILLLAHAARKQLGSTASRKQARETLDEQIRKAALAARDTLGLSMEAVDEAIKVAQTTYKDRVLAPEDLSVMKEAVALLKQITAPQVITAPLEADSDDSYYDSSSENSDED